MEVLGQFLCFDLNIKVSLALDLTVYVYVRAYLHLCIGNH